MQVSIRFFTVLREIIGKREETLQFGDSEKVTLSSVFDALSSCYGEPFTDYVFDAETGKVKGFLQLLINGQNTPSNEWAKTELHDGDVLAIIPPVGGG